MLQPYRVKPLRTRARVAARNVHIIFVQWHNRYDVVSYVILNCNYLPPLIAWAWTAVLPSFGHFVRPVTAHPTSHQYSAVFQIQVDIDPPPSISLVTAFVWTDRDLPGLHLVEENANDRPDLYLLLSTLDCDYHRACDPYDRIPENEDLKVGLDLLGAGKAVTTPKGRIGHLHPGY
jgi:hypothetical protein